MTKIHVGFTYPIVKNSKELSGVSSGVNLSFKVTWAPPYCDVFPNKIKPSIIL